MASGTTIYVSLGSNIKPGENISQALELLRQQLTDCVVSPFYQSAAVGMQGPDFINGVLAGNTLRSYQEVLQWLKEIERKLGRIRTANKFTNRPLDLDLLLYGDTLNATLPHPEIATEAYVLQPLFDIAPELIHPTLSKSMRSLRNNLYENFPEKFDALLLVSLD